jgi:hypothetical protein
MHTTAAVLPGTQPQSMSLTQIQQRAAQPLEARAPAVEAGVFTLASFELLQRVAKGFALSTLVPAAYQTRIVKFDRYGKEKDVKDNPAGLSNCMIALSMAQRLGADPMAVMQNLHIIEGRPSWSSTWIIAAINASGKFSPLRFDVTDLGPRTVEYQSSGWENGERYTKKEKVDILDMRFVAWALEKATGERLESPPVTIAQAVLEGWYTKNGSKWQTMPELMGRYRSAAFFGRLYAPEILMGLSTQEEATDLNVVDMEPSPPPPEARTVQIQTLAPRRLPPRRFDLEDDSTKPDTTLDNSQSPDPETGEVAPPRSAAAVTAAAPEAATPTTEPAFDIAGFADRMAACQDVDTLNLMVDEVRSRNLNAAQSALLADVYRNRVADLERAVSTPASAPPAPAAKGRQQRPGNQTTIE